MEETIHRQTDGKRKQGRYTTSKFFHTNECKENVKEQDPPPRLCGRVCLLKKEQERKDPVVREKGEIQMANVNDPKNQGKKMDANTAQKLREQLANRVSELSDEELSSVAGGTTTTPTIVASITAITTATGTEATKSVITGCVPSSGGSIPGPVPSPGASTI